MTFQASKYFASRVRSLRRLAAVSAVRSEQYSCYPANAIPLFVVRILQEEPRQNTGYRPSGHVPPGGGWDPPRLLWEIGAELLAADVKVYRFCDYGAMYNIVLRSAGLSVTLFWTCYGRCYGADTVCLLMPSATTLVRLKRNVLSTDALCPLSPALPTFRSRAIRAHQAPS